PSDASELRSRPTRAPHSAKLVHRHCPLTSLANSGRSPYDAMARSINVTRSRTSGSNPMGPPLRRGYGACSPLRRRDFHAGPRDRSCYLFRMPFAPSSPSRDPSLPAPPSPRTLRDRAREFIETFAALRGAPRVFWICNAVNMFDGAAYFGILNIIQLFLGKTLHFGDVEKHWALMSLSATLALSRALLASLSDRLRVRRALTPPL